MLLLLLPPFVSPVLLLLLLAKVVVVVVSSRPEGGLLQLELPRVVLVEAPLFFFLTMERVQV